MTRVYRVDMFLPTAVFFLLLSCAKASSTSVFSNKNTHWSPEEYSILFSFSPSLFSLMRLTLFDHSSTYTFRRDFTDPFTQRLVPIFKEHLPEWSDQHILYNLNHHNYTIPSSFTMDGPAGEVLPWWNSKPQDDYFETLQKVIANVESNDWTPHQKCIMLMRLLRRAGALDMIRTFDLIFGDKVQNPFLEPAINTDSSDMFTSIMNNEKLSSYEKAILFVLSVFRNTLPAYFRLDNPTNRTLLRMPVLLEFSALVFGVLFGSDKIMRANTESRILTSIKHFATCVTMKCIVLNVISIIKCDFGKKLFEGYSELKIGGTGDLFPVLCAELWLYIPLESFSVQYVADSFLKNSSANLLLTHIPPSLIPKLPFNLDSYAKMAMQMPLERFDEVGRAIYESNIPLVNFADEFRYNDDVYYNEII